MNVWHFSCPSLPKVKGLVVIGIFVQVYQRLKFWLSLALFVQVCLRWKFYSVCHGFFYWSLWLWIPMVKILWFGVCLWATSGIPLSHKFCDLECAFEQPMASRSATHEFAFAEGNLWHTAVKTVRTPVGNCWHGIRNTHIYVHRERKY